MNEKIKTLAEQATLAVTKPDGHYIVQEWQSKFAELIVRECAAEAHRRVCIEGNDNMIYAHLLEHFRVEE